MLATAIILFAIAAIGGVVMAWYHFSQDLNPPTLFAWGHGALAALALLLLIIAILGGGGNGGVVASLILFIIAAIGGFWLLSLHVRDQRLVSFGVLSHAGVAVVAFIVLLLAVI